MMICKLMKKQVVPLGFSPQLRPGYLYFPLGNFEKQITALLSLARGGDVLTSPETFAPNDVNHQLSPLYRLLALEIGQRVEEEWRKAVTDEGKMMAAILSLSPIPVGDK